MQPIQHRTHPGSRASQAVPPMPVTGPISLLPEDAVLDIHRQAVENAGGTLIPLGPETRGVMFLAYRRHTELRAALEQYPDISWVQLPFAGVDIYRDIMRDFGQKGVVFTSAKGAYSEPVAEHTLALILAAKKELVMRARATTWGENGGTSLYGNNVVIVGAGGITALLVEQLKPFRPTITIVRRQNTPMEGADSTVTFDQLDHVLPDADVVVLACAITDETYQLMDARRLALMKPTADLINIGRGPLIKTDDLVECLQRGGIHACATDVTDPEPLPDGHPLWSMDNCLITPHTADTVQQIAELFSERVLHNVRAFLGDGEFVGIVDIEAGY